MNFFVLGLGVLASASLSASTFAEEAFTDWAKPPVACIEDLVPKGLPCLDLAGVADPMADLPPLTPAETKYWTVDHKADLSLCRAREVQRREAARPGSHSAWTVELAWMWVKQFESLPDLIDAIYDAAETADMPPWVLFGALKQESLLSNLGMAVDGGNYSCGIGQVNVVEWCQYMKTLPAAKQRQMGWPVGVSCGSDTMKAELAKPFYDIAVKRLNGRHDYELTPAEFAGITKAEVLPGFPAGDATKQTNRFLAVSSFVKNCQDLRHGVASKGKELRRLFDTLVPTALKGIEVYKRGQRAPLACQRPYRSKYYPLHTGWLLADAIYNAGGRQVSVLQYYYRMTKASHESGEAWKKFDPLKLIEGLHWGGKWNEATQKIESVGVSGAKTSQAWFKTCVVQRHIANVIQYAAEPGAVMAKPLDQGGCSRTSVPEYRKKSPGRIPAKKPVLPERF